MRITQETRVMQYLLDFGSITTLEGQIDLGIRRTENVINNMINDSTPTSILKRNGGHIEKKWETGTNRYGEPTKWLRYHFVKDEVA